MAELTIRPFIDLVIPWLRTFFVPSLGIAFACTCFHYSCRWVVTQSSEDDKAIYWALYGFVITSAIFIVQKFF